MIEQLHYTWSKDGYGVGQGEQVVAASPGLQDMRSPLVQAALRLCRTPSEPRVFSGATHGEFALIARRRRAGVDGRGRDGRGFVHLLAVPLESFRAEHLSSLTQSGLWADDESVGVRELPVLEPKDIRGRAATVPLASLEAALAMTLYALANDRKVVLDTLDKSDALAMIGRVSSELGGSAHPLLVAFSTHESAGSGAGYVLLGQVSGAHAYMRLSGPVPPEAGGAARALLEDGKLIRRFWEQSLSLDEVARRAIAIGQYRQGAGRSAALKDIVSGDAEIWRAVMKEHGPVALARDLAANDKHVMASLPSLPDACVVMLVQDLATGELEGASSLLPAIAAAHWALARSVAMEWAQRDELDLRKAAALVLLQDQSGAATAVLTKLIAQRDLARSLCQRPDLPEVWRARAITGGQFSDTELVPVLRGYGAEVVGEVFLARPALSAALLLAHYARSAGGVSTSLVHLRRIADRRGDAAAVVNEVIWELLARDGDPLRMRAELELSRKASPYENLMWNAYRDECQRTLSDHGWAPTFASTFGSSLKLPSTTDPRCRAWRSLLTSVAKDKWIEGLPAGLDHRDTGVAHALMVQSNLQHCALGVRIVRAEWYALLNLLHHEVRANADEVELLDHVADRVRAIPGSPDARAVMAMTTLRALLRLAVEWGQSPSSGLLPARHRLGEGVERLARSLSARQLHSVLAQELDKPFGEVQARVARRWWHLLYREDPTAKRLGIKY